MTSAKCLIPGLLLSGLYSSVKSWFHQLSLLDELFTNSSVAAEKGHLDNAEKAELLVRNMNEMLTVLDGCMMNFVRKG